MIQKRITICSLIFFLFLLYDTFIGIILANAKESPLSSPAKGGSEPNDFNYDEEDELEYYYLTNSSYEYPPEFENDNSDSLIRNEEKIISVKENDSTPAVLGTQIRIGI